MPSREHEDAKYIRRACVELTLRQCIDKRIEFKEGVSQVAVMNVRSLFHGIKNIDENLHRRLIYRMKESEPLDNCFGPWRQKLLKHYEKFLEEPEEVRRAANDLITQLGDDIGKFDRFDGRFETECKNVGFDINSRHFQLLLMFMSMANFEPEVAIARLDTVFGLAAPPHPDDLLPDDVGAQVDDVDVTFLDGGGEELQPAAEETKEEEEEEEGESDVDDVDDDCYIIIIDDDETDDDVGVGGGEELQQPAAGSSAGSLSGAHHATGSASTANSGDISIATGLSTSASAEDLALMDLGDTVSNNEQHSDAFVIQHAGDLALMDLGETVSNNEQHSDAFVIQHAGATETLLRDENRSQHAGAKRNMICLLVLILTTFFVISAKKYVRSPAHEVNAALSDGPTQEGSDILNLKEVDSDASNATSHTDRAGSSAASSKNSGAGDISNATATAAGESNSTLTSGGGTAYHFQSAQGQCDNTTHEGSGNVLGVSSGSGGSASTSTEVPRDISTNATATAGQSYCSTPSCQRQPSLHGPSTGAVSESEGAPANGRDQSEFDKLQSASQNYELAWLRIIIIVLLLLLGFLGYNLRQKLAELIVSQQRFDQLVVRHRTIQQVSATLRGENLTLQNSLEDQEAFYRWKSEQLFTYQHLNRGLRLQVETLQMQVETYDRTIALLSESNETLQQVKDDVDKLSDDVGGHEGDMQNLKLDVEGYECRSRLRELQAGENIANVQERMDTIETQINEHKEGVETMIDEAFDSKAKGIVQEVFEESTVQKDLDNLSSDVENIKSHLVDTTKFGNETADRVTTIEDENDAEENRNRLDYDEKQAALHDFGFTKVPKGQT